MPQTFEQTVRIRFSHCDPAGIVYHPQYLVILNHLMEDFFREVVGTSYEEMVYSGVGLPLVGIRCDFASPSRVGDICKCAIWVEHIGTSSARFAMTIEGQDGIRLRCAETVACVKRDGKGGIEKSPLPEAVKTRLRPFLAADPIELRA